ncbi:MAG: Mitochondrial GTPase [Piccolia ochrophora]|nr:MAG: Mitochondrial GTPase [Piccolia ochrophora]
MSLSFVPRASFQALDSLPRSYFLGHHRAGLAKMQTMLSSINLILECRDYRIPLSSYNPLFEASLAGKERVVVYTKRDLGTSGQFEEDRRKHDLLRQCHHPAHVLFCNHKNKRDVSRVLDYACAHASESTHALTGSRIFVVGMPNVGKSSLLNAVRMVGVGKGKAAYTGDQPGVTRKIASGVKIAEGKPGDEGVYLLDTPGVFMPYVSDGETMLKLALCGCVKDTVIPLSTMADYLLFHLNLENPALYEDYCAPTNDVVAFLEGVGRKTGRLKKGGVPDLEATAIWVVQRWRAGEFGRFMLDEITDEAIARRQRWEAEQGGSLNQARKAEKAERREKARAKHLGTA